MRIGADLPAAIEGRTIFLHGRKSVTETKLLKTIAYNTKVGNRQGTVMKGKWKGMPMFGLTLEERATCSTDCEQWLNCYGNNMFQGARVDHRDPELLMVLLGGELSALQAKHPNGFIIRLHILGDFFSVDYAEFWKEALAEYPALHLWGSTHRLGDIAEVIASMNGERCWIRFSDTQGTMSSNVMGEGVQCPQQTGKTQSCLTCGVCWSTTKAVRFLKH